jgi:hypothetical protein
LALVRGVLENVPHRLAGPDSLTGSSQFTSFLKPTANFGKAATILSDPGKDLLDYPCLFRDWLKSRLTSTLADRDIAVPERSARHYVERTALGCMFLASATPLHDFGPLVFGDDALYLQQQVIFRALAEWPVQEHQLDAATTPLVEKKNLIRVVTGQPVRRMDVDPINGADGGQIAQPIQSWADQRRSAISIIDKLSLARHRCAVAFGALAERCCLTFNRVRGRLLFAGDTRVERGSKCCHKKPPRGGWEINWPQASTGSVGTEFNFERRITMSETSTLISCTGRITRAELAKLPTPPATETHIPIPHAAVVETLVETLSHRQISVVGEEFAVSKDDMEMFGVLDLETSFEGCRFAIGIRNANNKRFRLACTVGLRVFVCHNLAFRGDYSPVLAKHSKHFSLEDALSIGVDRMQRNFEPLRRQVESWQAEQLSAEVAKLTIYRAFIEGDLEVPRHLARRVHELYFNPQHEEFQPRTMWSLSNAFTSAFKELDPIPQFRATAKLGSFLGATAPA